MVGNSLALVSFLPVKKVKTPLKVVMSDIQCLFACAK